MTTVAIAGGVGSSLALNLLMRPEPFAVTVPVTLGPAGAERIDEWPLAGGELAARRAAADAVRAAASSAGP